MGNGAWNCVLVGTTTGKKDMVETDGVFGMKYCCTNARESLHIIRCSVLVLSVSKSDIKEDNLGRNLL